MTSHCCSVCRRRHPTDVSWIFFSFTAQDIYSYREYLLIDEGNKSVVIVSSSPFI